PAGVGSPAEADVNRCPRSIPAKKIHPESLQFQRTQSVIDQLIWQPIDLLEQRALRQSRGKEPGRIKTEAGGMLLFEFEKSFADDRPTRQQADRQPPAQPSGEVALEDLEGPHQFVRVQTLHAEVQRDV